MITTEPSYSFTVTEAASYEAHFQLKSYEVTATANPTAGGTVSGAGTYNHGATCTLNATANTVSRLKAGDMLFYHSVL